MPDPIIDFERASQELDAFHKQLRSGARIHLPAYHRTIKACEAAVSAIVASRLGGDVAEVSRLARQCLGKKRYATRADAQRQIGGHAQSVRESLNAYRCNHCASFHIGNLPGKREMTGAEA